MVISFHKVPNSYLSFPSHSVQLVPQKKKVQINPVSKWSWLTRDFCLGSAFGWQKALVSTLWPHFWARFCFAFCISDLVLFILLFFINYDSESERRSCFYGKHKFRLKVRCPNEVRGAKWRGNQINCCGSRGLQKGGNSSDTPPHRPYPCACPLATMSILSGGNKNRSNTNTTAKVVWLLMIMVVVVIMRRI